MGIRPGNLAIVDAATGTSWTDLFTPKGLSVQASTLDVATYRNLPGVSAPLVANELRQIRTNEAYVDIVPANGRESYEIRFYSRSATTFSSETFPYDFAGKSPYVIYKVERNGGDTKLKITVRITNRMAPHRSELWLRCLSALVRPQISLGCSQTGTYPASLRPSLRSARGRLTVSADTR